MKRHFSCLDPVNLSRFNRFCRSYIDHFALKEFHVFRYCYGYRSPLDNFRDRQVRRSKSSLENKVLYLYIVVTRFQNGFPFDPFPAKRAAKCLIEISVVYMRVIAPRAWEEFPFDK